MMKKTVILFAAMFSVISLCGFAWPWQKFSKAKFEENDRRFDTENAVYLAKAKQEFQTGWTKPRPVNVVFAKEKGSIFLTKNMVPIFSEAEKRGMLRVLEGKVRESVRQMSILKQVADGTPGAYFLQYHIVNADIAERPVTRQVQIGTRPVRMGRVSIPMPVYRTDHGIAFDHCMTVVVEFFNPQGELVFSYTGEGRVQGHEAYGQHIDRRLAHNSQKMNEAVAVAYEQAMRNFANDFTPPMWVEQTIGNGAFLKLNVGKNHNLKVGDVIEFFRVVNDQEIVLGRGIVGDREAPLEHNNAWVSFPDNGDSKRNNVHIGTSARIVKQ